MGEGALKFPQGRSSMVGCHGQLQQLRIRISRPAGLQLLLLMVVATFSLVPTKAASTSLLREGGGVAGFGTVQPVLQRRNYLVGQGSNFQWKGPESRWHPVALYGPDPAVHSEMQHPSAHEVRMRRLLRVIGVPKVGAPPVSGGGLPGSLPTTPPGPPQGL